MSQHFFVFLREPFRFLLPADREYQSCFDRFEYLRALAETDMTGEPEYIGSFGWRWKLPGEDVRKEVEVEENPAGGNWPPYQAEWFQGKRERFKAAKDKVDQIIARLGWH